MDVEDLCTSTPRNKLINSLTNGSRVLSFWTPHVFNAHLRNAWVLSSNGFALTERGRFLLFGITYCNYALAKDLAGLAPRVDEGRLAIEIPEGVETIEEEALFIGGHSNFGHFNFEILPRPGPFLDFVEAAGVPRSDIQLVSPRKALLFRALALPSCAIYRGYLEDQNTYAWREGLWFLREIGRTAEGRPMGRRIYTHARDRPLEQARQRGGGPGAAGG